VNTPYPELVADTTARDAALAEWNAGIERARRDYWANPTASCRRDECDHLAIANGFCKGHHHQNDRKRAK
jgi:hypothetical protein